MAYRTDRAQLRTDLRPPQKRADGSTLYHGAPTRAGVFEYELEDGTKRREYRPPEEVSNPESLESLHFAPVVAYEHTPKGEARKRSVGTVGQDVEWVPDAEEVQASFVVRDDAVNQDIADGMQELSCGYDVDLEETPGVSPEGERYDAIQRGMPRADGKRGPIVYEHLAIVHSGRAGPSVRLRADSATARLPRSSWRTDAAVMTTASAASAAADPSSAATGRSKEMQMAQTSNTRNDCGPGGMAPEEKKDGSMPPPGAPPAGGPPMSPEEKLKMLEAENAKLKADLAKMQAAQDAPPVPRATDSAPEMEPDGDEEEMATDAAGPGPARMDSARVQRIIDARFEREGLVRTAAALGVEVRADAKRSDIKIAITEKLNGKKLPQERLDSKDKTARRYYVDAAFDLAMTVHREAIDAEKRARGETGAHVQRHDSAAGKSVLSAAYDEQQARYEARSKGVSK